MTTKDSAAYEYVMTSACILGSIAFVFLKIATFGFATIFLLAACHGFEERRTVATTALLAVFGALYVWQLIETFFMPKRFMSSSALNMSSLFLRAIWTVIGASLMYGQFILATKTGWKSGVAVVAVFCFNLTFVLFHASLLSKKTRETLLPFCPK